MNCVSVWCANSRLIAETLWRADFGKDDHYEGRAGLFAPNNTGGGGTDILRHECRVNPQEKVRCGVCARAADTGGSRDRKQAGLPGRY